MHTPFLNSLLKQAASVTFPKHVPFRTRRPRMTVHYGLISRFLILPPVFDLHPPLSDALSSESHSFLFLTYDYELWVSTVLSRFLPLCVLPALYDCVCGDSRDIYCRSAFYELDADDILAVEPRVIISFRLRGGHARYSMGGGHAEMHTATQRCRPSFWEWSALQRSTRTRVATSKYHISAQYLFVVSLRVSREPVRPS